MILNRQKKLKPDLRRAGRVLSRVLRHLQYPGIEVNVIFLDDAGIRDFNRTYLRRDRPTNVISFSMQEGEFGAVNPDILGDVLISVESAERDALKAKIDFADMLDYLIVHGVLHLLGFDHEASREAAKEMEKKEEEIFLLLHGYAISPGHGQ